MLNTKNRRVTSGMLIVTLIVLTLWMLQASAPTVAQETSQILLDELENNADHYQVIHFETGEEFPVKDKGDNAVIFFWTRDTDYNDLFPKLVAKVGSTTNITIAPGRIYIAKKGEKVMISFNHADGGKKARGYVYVTTPSSIFK